MCSRKILRHAGGRCQDLPPGSSSSGRPRGSSARQTSVQILWSPTGCSARARGQAMHSSRRRRCCAGLAAAGSRGSAAQACHARWEAFDLHVGVRVPTGCATGASTACHATGQRLNPAAALESGERPEGITIRAVTVGKGDHARHPARPGRAVPRRGRRVPPGRVEDGGVPLGEYPELTAKGIPPTGTENYGGPVVTATGLPFIGATADETFRAFDASTGKILWQAKLPFGGNATPSVYAVNGKQYVVISAGGAKSGRPAGGSIVAFALPN